MSRSLHPTGKSLILASFAIFALTPAFSQEAPSFPPWLKSYPGPTPAVHSSGTLVESSYTAAAQPEEIIRHYRALFEAAGLPFQPNADGLGTSIRGEARECDLLIQIRSRADGTFVGVNCSAKTASSPASASASLPTEVRENPSRPQSPRIGAVGISPPAPPAPQPHTGSVDFMELHKQKAAEMGLGLHRQHHDAPAPPLVWPSWLAHVSGAALRPAAGVDQSKNATLRAQYTTNAPMTDIYHFYRDLLNAHEYPARSSMSTGQTMTGVQQNAIGYVEGSNYPDGAPGAYSDIHVSFSRSILNGPITVTLRFTTHDFIASRGY
jgi:hypothetical protein